MSKNKELKYIELFRLGTQDEIIASIKRIVEKQGIDITEDDYGNLYITKGMPSRGWYYPGYTAHLDTVHKWKTNDVEVYKYDNILYGMNINEVSQVGVGGDDKCGIVIALNILRTLPCCKIAFFKDEEVGCKGSSKADKDFFDDCSYLAGIDRRGNDDLIFNAAGTVLGDGDFKKTVSELGKKYNLAVATGAITDVATLVDDGIKCSAINVSAGYYRPHTSTEVVDMVDMDNTFDFLIDMATITDKQYKAPEQPKTAYGSYRAYSYSSGFKKCPVCDTWVTSITQVCNCGKTSYHTGDTASKKSVASINEDTGGDNQLPTLFDEYNAWGLFDSPHTAEHVLCSECGLKVPVSPENAKLRDNGDVSMCCPECKSLTLANTLFYCLICGDTIAYDANRVNIDAFDNESVCPECLLKEEFI